MSVRLSFKKIIIAAAILILPIIFFLTRGNTAADAPTSGFEMTTIDRGPIKRSVATSGQVRALVDVQVGSQISGQIMALHADFNSEVKKEDLLAEIDPQTFKSRVEIAEAQLDVARSGLEVRQANIRKSQALLAQSQSELERFAPLEVGGAVSQLELDNIRAEVSSAQADLDSAKAQVDNARAVVSQRQAALREANVDLERTQIRSPIDGVVIERSIDVGQTVAASLQAPVLFQIAQDLTQIQIEASVNEADIGSIRDGNEVTFTVDAYPDRNFRGIVRQVRLAPIEEQNIISYAVVINANNPGKILFPGMTATAEIITGEREDVLRISNRVLRFKPSDIEEQSRQGPPSATARAARFAQQAKDLGLSSAQQKELQERMGKLFSGGRPSGNVREAIGKIYKSILNDDQYKNYEEVQAANAQTRPATLWVKDENGAPTPLNVRLGITDGSYTEVISLDVDTGQKVILREING